MKLRLLLLPTLVLSVLGFGAKVQAQAPAQFVYVGGFGARLGEPAPTLVSPKWIKGSPVVFQPGKVTVLGFWSTWCVPCRETFPQLAELARRYRGKVNFAGVSVWERQEDVKSGAYVAKVQQFVRSLGSQMPYSVAVDDPQNTNAIRWLGQWGQDIPKAFIIDQQGRVAWSGHPLADLEDALGKVVSGKYDIQREAQRQRFQVVTETHMRDLMSPVQQALVIQAPKQAVTAIENAITKDPNVERSLGAVKFQMLLKYDEPAAYAYAKKLANGICKDNASSLNLISWTIVDDETGLKKPDLKTALEIARRANELTNFEDAYMLDTLAYALYKSGEKSKALEYQIKAVDIAERMQGVNPKIMQDLRNRLALFRKSNKIVP